MPDEYSDDPSPSLPEHGRSEIVAAENRNLWTLAVHFVCLRIGWVFKTETVIMPAFLDTIAGAGWLRGCLPVLNRLGSSFPPLFYAAHLRNSPQKKWSLVVATLLMAGPFMILSIVWFNVHDQLIPLWLPGLFLACYTMCFVGTGLNRLSFNTVQGKLIRSNRRGLLIAASGLFGSITAIGCAILLLPAWLGLDQDRGFGWIFAFTAIGFIFAGLTAILVREPADPRGQHRPRIGEVFANAWALFRDHRDFRRLAIVSMLFISVQLAFPHFQRLARDGLDDSVEKFHLMLWVVAQNTGFGVFSLISGRVADVWGNRLVIRLQVLVLATTPLLSLALASLPNHSGATLFWIPFALLGLTPLTFRTINNYVLELAPPEQHPRFVSTLNLVLAVPFVTSPLVGLMIDQLGFPVIFITISGIVGLGGLLTFRMTEPRHRDHDENSTPVDTTDALQ